MLIRLDRERVLAEQVYQALRTDILAGRLAAGARLPSTRTLAHDAGVSRNVALIAYARLLDEGYLTTRRGAGSFVAPELPDDLLRVGAAPASRPARRRRPAAPVRVSRYVRRATDATRGGEVSWAATRKPVRYDFRYGRPPLPDFPYATWSRIVARRARKASIDELDYGTPEGLAVLRETVADYLRRARGVVCDADQVLIVNGSQQALDLVARVLVEPATGVVVEEPCYRPARVVFTAAGARLVSIAVDGEGLRVDRLRARARSCRLAYVTPSHQFPTGAVMPLARRLELLAWADASGAHVLEDDYDSEYRYGGRPIEALQGLDRRGAVLYSGTFSKVMFPALRLGYLVVPEPLVRAFRTAKALADTGSAVLSQLAVADFIQHGHFERHLRRSRALNAARRATLLDALDRQLGDRIEIAASDAGLHVLVWLRGVPFGRTPALIRKAERAGVRVYSVAPFYAAPPRRAGLLLGFSALPERDIVDGVQRLAPILRRA